MVMLKNGDVNGKLEVNGLMLMSKNYIKIYMIFMHTFVTSGSFYLLFQFKFFLDSFYSYCCLQSSCTIFNSKRNRYNCLNHPLIEIKTISFSSVDLGLKVHLLPEKLLQTIESLLNDPQERIQIAAAIALITLHRFSPEVFFFFLQIIFSLNFNE